MRLVTLNCWFYCNNESQQWAGTLETAVGNTYLHTFNSKCIWEVVSFIYLFLAFAPGDYLWSMKTHSALKEGGGMMRPQWLIVAPRVLRQMELLSLLLFSRELTSFLKPLLHISVGNGLPNFPTLSPCISYVHINKSSGGFWTRRWVGGLLYVPGDAGGTLKVLLVLFRSGSAKKTTHFSLLSFPWIQTCVGVRACL